VELEDVRAAADNYELALLTAQGDPLVTSVIRALKELGFEVTDVDATVAAGGLRLEDLQVRDPSVPGWAALAEVKGYRRWSQGQRPGQARPLR